MMNNDKNYFEKLPANVKKYTVGFGCCLLVVASFALIMFNSKENSEPIAENTTSKVAEVEAELTNVPDTRNYETIIVPATEITTIIADEKTAPETTLIRTAVSYSLPLGTDIGKDFSRGVPVYNEVMGDWRTHDGVDFNGACGDGVKSIANGIVKEITDDPFMGGTVVIDHGDGVVATYSGIEVDETLKRGIMVSENEKIGEVSFVPSESDSQFPHLHLEIRVDGQLCDPLEIMGYYE